MDWFSQDGILFEGGTGLVLDDKNMPGKTLGIRRLQCQRDDLYNLKKGILDFPSMIGSNYTIFIDSNGTPFKYKKTLTCKLIYHLVEKIHLKESCSLVKCTGVPFLLEIPRPPYGDARWARVLYFGDAAWMLYDFTTHRGKDSYRRV